MQHIHASSIMRTEVLKTVSSRVQSPEKGLRLVWQGFIDTRRNMLAPSDGVSPRKHLVRMYLRVKTKGKINPVTGRGGPQGYETSRIPHFLDNRLIDGGEVVSLTHRPPFTPRKIPGTHFF
jgi:hypothetical protein